MSRKHLTLGLFGFGCVGFGLYEVLQKTPALKTTIKKVCVKSRNKKRPVSDIPFTFEKSDILNDEEINVIVELIDDADAAFEIVAEALRKGKAVVTANKKMIAEHFNELLDLQRRYQVPLLYEAACCASIPIIRNLEEYYDNDLLESVEGIVNGSTNYILTKTNEENLSYEQALQQAQQNGYAESNPLLDVGGFDAKYKLLILVAHAFGLVASPEQIIHSGIDRLGRPELDHAREKGYKIKLVAQAEKTASGKIRAFVLPKFVHRNDKLFSVDDVFNGVKTKSCFSDTQFFSGRGAGAHPTASAVLSDISALSYDYHYEYKKLDVDAELETSSTIYLRVFLRHPASQANRLKRLFAEVEASFLSDDAAYIIGTLSLHDIERLLQRGTDHSVVLLDQSEEQKRKRYEQEPEIEWNEFYA